MKKIRILNIALGTAEAFVGALFSAYCILGTILVLFCMDTLMVEWLTSPPEIKIGCMAILWLSNVISLLLNVCLLSEKLFKLKEEKEKLKTDPRRNSWYEDHAIGCVNEAAGRCLAALFIFLYTRYVFVPGNALAIYGVPFFIWVVKMLLSWIITSLERKLFEKEVEAHGPSLTV